MARIARFKSPRDSWRDPWKRMFSYPENTWKYDVSFFKYNEIAYKRNWFVLLDNRLGK